MKIFYGLYFLSLFQQYQDLVIIIIRYVHLIGYHYIFAPSFIYPFLLLLSSLIHFGSSLNREMELRRFSGLFESNELYQ